MLESVRKLTFYRTAIILNTPYSFKCTICLHSTLFVCTTLIISVLRSVDNFVFYLYLFARRLHLSAH